METETRQWSYVRTFRTNVVTSIRRFKELFTSCYALTFLRHFDVRTFVRKVLTFNYRLALSLLIVILACPYSFPIILNNDTVVALEHKCKGFFLNRSYKELQRTYEERGLFYYIARFINIPILLQNK